MKFLKHFKGGGGAQAITVWEPLHYTNPIFYNTVHCNLDTQTTKLLSYCRFLNI
jgi:hypothetical protein